MAEQLNMNGLVIGSGAGQRPRSIAAMTDGQLAIGKTGYAPAPALPTGRGVTTGAGSLAIASNAIMAFVCAGTGIAAGQTRFIGSFLSAANGDVRLAAPFAGTAKNLALQLSGSPGATDTVTATLEIGGVDTALTIGVTDANQGQDTTHTVAVALMDRLSVKLVATAGAATVYAAATIELVSA